MDLLKELKLAGYKVVFMKPKFPVTTLPEYDELIMKQMKVSGGDSRPATRVISSWPSSAAPGSTSPSRWL